MNTGTPPIYQCRTVNVGGANVLAGGPKGVEAKRRKRRKQAKRAIARANRIAREGIRWEDVYCPVCARPPKRRSYSSDFYCTPNGRDPRPHHAPHQDRCREAARKKAQILEAGERARDLLSRMDETDFA